jgi:hypothetical protein
MPLINFGSILGFALEVENQNLEFISSAATAPSCSDYKDLFEGLIKNSNKRIKEIKRVRQENVTEMILESIEGFTRDPFVLDSKDIQEIGSGEILKSAQAMFERSVRYYDAAAQKLKGQSEVSRSLKTLGKKCKRDFDQLIKQG